jgi:alpha-tubulin suppressor-like RCC1 family protein
MRFRFFRGVAPLLCLAAWAGCNAIAGIENGNLAGGNGTGDGGLDATTFDGPGADTSPGDSPSGNDASTNDAPVSGDATGSDGGDAGGDPVVQITAGGDSACAVTQSGALYCWGPNTHGAVGDGTTTQRNTAVHITKDVKGATLPPISQVSAGGYHVCARATSGAIYCWGSDVAGQLGDGIDILADAAASYFQQNAPQLVPNLTAPAVACGFFHTCALGANAFVTCWGSNENGELGHTAGTYGDVSTGAWFYSWANSNPVRGNGVTGATQNSLGLNFTCSNEPVDNNTYCMGTNYSGQLGDLEAGASSANPIPVKVDPSGYLTAGKEVAAFGFLHACALDGQGDLYCWGSSGTAALGPGVPLVKGNLVYATQVMTGVSHVAVGGYTTCVVDATEHVQCWGGNTSGVLGHDPATDPISSCPDTSVPCNPNPSTLMAGGTPFGPANTLSVGLQFACALKHDATVWCWGENAGGQLGNNLQGANDAGQNYTPVQVLGLP